MSRYPFSRLAFEEMKQKINAPRDLSPSQLSTLTRLYERLGPEATNFFQYVSWGSLSATKKMEKKRVMNARFKLVRLFLPYMERLLHDPLLEKKGYRIAFFHGDPPLSLSVTLENVMSQSIVARFNFDLVLSKKKPGIVVGNMQGHHPMLIYGFAKDVGKSPLDYFVQRINAVFQNPAQRMALNPRQHPYRVRALSSGLILNRMVRDGKLEKDERDAFSKKDASAVLKARVNALLEEEVARIRRDATGMHKAAYKKAGYHLTRARFYRPQRKRPV